MCKDAKPHELCKSGCHDCLRRSIAYLVELHPGCWLAKGDGDPCRTLVEANAQRFKTEPAARGALTRARKYRPFKAARTVEVDR